jgi:hypothetical protein
MQVKDESVATVSSTAQTARIVSGRPRAGLDTLAATAYDSSLVPG